MNTTENARYREAAEYNTTVEEAQKAAGIVTPAYCLAYELRQYVAAYSQQVYSRENRDEEGPELLSEEHPDYPQRLADRKEEGERQLREIYALHGQELADEWAAARSDTLDERLLLACLLKESAHRLLAGYAHYLTQVGTGRILPAERLGVPIPFRISGSHIRPVETFASRLSQMQERDKTGNPGYGLSYSSGKYAELDRALTAAGAGAAELAHFYRLLEAFQADEQVPTGTTVPAAFPVAFASYIKEDCRTRLLPFLTSQYTNPKPKALASLLFALTDLGLMTISLTENQTELHQSLAVFGSIGTRQALNTNITKLNSASERENRAIEKQRKLIKEYLATSST